MRRSLVQFMALLVALFLVSPASLYSQTGVSAPLIYVPFEEGSGTTTLNKGTAGTVGTFVAEAAFDASVPEGAFAPTSNTSSLYLSPTAPLGKGVTFPVDPLVGLTQFTITAWVYPETIDQGAGGNRIFTTWQRGPDGSPNRRAGVELVWLNQQYQFSVNQAPDWPTDLYEGPFSGENSSTSDWGWQFIAVTYDTRTDDLEFFPNAQMYEGYKGYDGAVEYFIGDGEHAAESWGEQVFDTGPVAASNVQPEFMIGSFTTQIMETFSGHDNRQFRGWIDEVRVYDKALTLAQILEVQKGVVTSVSHWTLY